MKNLTTSIEQDDGSDYLIRIPEDLLMDLQWFDNQKLTLSIQEDGSLLLSKAINKITKTEENKIYF